VGVIDLKRLSSIVLLAFLAVSFVACGNALGAALNVDGGASPVNAAPGNSNNALLLISVTDQDGAAESGLGVSNFEVDATIVGPGGALVDITRADESPYAPGFYILEIVPTTYQGGQYTWVTGVYLFSVTVERGADRGQTVVVMEMCGPCVSGSAQPSVTPQAKPPERTVQPSVMETPSLSAVRLPDLKVTQITAGTPSFEEDGAVANVPLTVTIKNFGGATSEMFKTSVDVIVGDGMRYVRPFTVPGQSDTWYPWQSGLGEGEEATFTGTLMIGVPSGESLYGQKATIIAKVDSCSGDEFTPEYCRVEESDETNNENEASVQLSQMTFKAIPLKMVQKLK
jgi:hypothetical protein